MFEHIPQKVRDCLEEDQDLDNSFYVKEEYKVTYKDEVVVQISQDDNGSVWVITHQGTEHCGEYEITAPLTDDDFKVYKEAP